VLLHAVVDELVDGVYHKGLHLRCLLLSLQKPLQQCGLLEQTFVIGVQFVVESGDGLLALL
jgi:hypothetical protein